MDLAVKAIKVGRPKSDRVLFELVGAGVRERVGHPGKSNPVNLNSPQPTPTLPLYWYCYCTGPAQLSI